MSRPILRIFILLISISSINFAQGPMWLNYTNGDVITALAEEGGAIWVGTTGGLVRIDKQSGNAVFFDKINSGLPHNEISAIAIAPDGRKWFGTAGGGLAQYDGSAWTRYSTTNSVIPENYTTGLAVNGNSDLWVGWRNLGVSKFNSRGWAKSSWNAQVNAICASAGSLIWVGANSALFRTDGNGWQQWNTGNGMPIYDVTAIAVDAAGLVWLGSSSQGLVQFNGVSQWVHYTSGNSGLPDNQISNIRIEKNGRIWVATKYGGLAGFWNNQWVVYNTANSGLPSNAVTCVLTDSEARLWIGTRAGLVRYDGVSWTRIATSSSPLPDNQIRAIAIDVNGFKWLATANGIARLNSGSWTIYSTRNSPLPSNDVSTVMTESNGDIWMGTVDAGLVRKSGETWTIYNTANSLIPHNYIRFIISEPGGAKWIGTGGGGLVKLKDQSWTLYNKFNSGLPDDYVIAMAFDRDGYPYIGTQYGLAYFKNGVWSKITDNSVQALSVQSNGVLWIGWLEMGVSKFDGVNWTGYNTENGVLPDNSVTSNIAIDRFGHKWLGLYLSGIWRFNDNAWEHYNVLNSGLTGDRVTAVAIDAAGNRWIGTLNGLSVFNEQGIAALVELAYFKVEQLSSGVRLTWRTASESNNYGFEIQCREENGAWQRIGFVPGYGTTHTPQYYRFFAEAVPGRDYRLRQIDTNGKSVYSPIVSISTSEPTFRLAEPFPNPCNASVSIEYDLPAAGWVEWNLYDVTGKIVLSKKGISAKGRQRFQMDIGSLASGPYIFNLTYNGRRLVRKVMVMK